MRGGVDVLGDRGGEGDDVVFDLGFDLVNAVDSESTAVTDCVSGGLRNEAEFRESLGSGDLDGEPAAVFIFVGPDPAHLRTGVASDQKRLLDE